MDLLTLISILFPGNLAGLARRQFFVQIAEDEDVFAHDVRVWEERTGVNPRSVAQTVLKQERQLVYTLCALMKLAAVMASFVLRLDSDVERFFTAFLFFLVFAAAASVVHVVFRQSIKPLVEFEVWTGRNHTTVSDFLEGLEARG